jgi:transcriptional regulator with PAS, ATPase and Fis domain
MLESELFGSRRGAFTGAENRSGLAASADGGTLFLDEIGDMPRALQAKLLRFLESSAYRPVGSTDVHKVDVRLVSATNAALEAAVEQRSFRSDLYYRICGAVISVPPLRERKVDVEFLAYHFLREACQKIGRPLPLIDSIAMARMMEYDWPGNVRELRNAIVGALVPLRDGSRITKAMLPQRLLDFSPANALKRFDAAALNEALLRCQGNMSELARSLGVPRQSIYRRLAEAGIDIHELRGK